MTPHVLIVEDDRAIATALSNLLERRGCRVTVSHSVSQALSKLTERSYDLGIVDRGLSDGDGLKVVEFADSSCYVMKTLLVSGKTSIEHRIEGLQAGASDYVTKPFSYQELELKVHKLLLSDKRAPSKLLSYQNISIQPKTGEVLISDVPKHLRRREAEILTCLIRHQKQVVTREMLIQYIWGDGYKIPDFRTIDVYVRRIRQVLDNRGAQIYTIRSYGFKLQ